MEEINEQEQQDWQCTFDALMEPVLILNTKWVVTRANLAAYELLARGTEDIIGKKCYTLFTDSSTPCSDCPIEYAQGKGLSRKLEMERPFLGKSLRVTCAPMFQGDKLVGYVHSAVDITHQRNLEKQLVQAQKMEAIATLAGGIAHDFNNILGAILGNADLLLYRIADARCRMDSSPVALSCDDIRDHLAAIQKAGKRAKDLVSQILAFSRQNTSRRRKVRISSMVKKAVKLLKSSLPATIELRIDIAENTGYIHADPTQIHQVLMNLCTNAVEALENQHGRIDISLQEVIVGGPNGLKNLHELKNGEYIVLSVADTGIGMSEDIMERIYDPFFTTRDVGEGTGMGLAVLHGIVTAHNGYIDVRSEPGRGTGFSIYFPKVKFQKEAVRTDPATNLSLGRETVVFVDDDEEIVKMHTEMLEYLGYTVIPASSGEEVLACLKEHLYEVDLLITDHTMPHMTGLELAHKISAIRSDLPVILCSGYAEPVSRQEAEKAGINAFLAKPFEMKELAETIRQVLCLSSRVMRILVIDDDEQMRALLKQAMQWAGFEVTTAENGRKGQQAFEERPTDLIITDLIMPEQEGLETIRVIKKNHPTVKIIAISGGGRIGPEAYLPAAMELGADRVFSKPFDIKELVANVQDLLNK
jgi:signal transduction histidine kinase/CheY-like chemotaxis protein